MHVIDEPLRNNMMDEKVVLRGRIAELEGVIREVTHLGFGDTESAKLKNSLADEE